MLKENYYNVKENIKKSCKRADRDENDVNLISVSKTKPVAMLQEVYDLGSRDFGENKVQEIMEKYDQLPDDIRWHMIGHLQTNKVKYIADKIYMIHSVESEKLAIEISKQAVKVGRIIPILIEVNVAEEESKFGIKCSECMDFVKSISNLPGIAVKGLMTIAPFVENPEDNREYFRKLKQLSVDIKKENIDNISMDFLSMGMTGDYQIAIEEGASFVRVGTGIFGERDYSVSR